ncbi:MAG: hypothetical protein AB1521_07530 [Bacteroidota bacterium]
MKKNIFIILLLLAAYVPTNKIVAQIDISSGASDRDLARVYVLGGKLSKEQEEKYLKEIPNEIKNLLLEIKNLDKDKYYGLLREAYNTFNNLSWSSSDYASVFFPQKEKSEFVRNEKKLDIETEVLLIKYKNAKTDQKTVLRNELMNSLNKLFDARESLKEEEIRYLESKIKELKESLTIRKNNKKQIVERRLKELLNEKDELKWE